jgi:hypothetical protein
VSHKPGGGNVKIENRKFDYMKVQAKDNTNKVFSSTHLERKLCLNLV